MHGLTETYISPKRKMPLLTSPTRCTSCLQRTQRIAELEGRISTLHQIKEDEHLLDSLAASASGFAETDSTLPWNRPNEGREPALPTAAAASADDPWPKLGGPSLSPAQLPSSQSHGPGSADVNGGTYPSRPISPVGLHLENRYQVLERQKLPKSISRQCSSPSLPGPSAAASPPLLLPQSAATLPAPPAPTLPEPRPVAPRRVPVDCSRHGASPPL